MAAEKKVNEEPEVCTICSDKYTSIIRKRVECRFCHVATCSKCIEQYLLSRTEDAHCVHCRVNYNDATLQGICTKTYLTSRYFKHRQEILINREKANLPSLQPAAMREIKQRKMEEMIRAKYREIQEMKEKRGEVIIKYSQVCNLHYTALKAGQQPSGFQPEMDQLLHESEQYRVRIQEKMVEVRGSRWENTNSEEKEEKEEERKKFIRRCTNNGCQGFLSTAWKCGICEYYSCSKCFMVKGKEHDVAHACKQEDVDTAELIKKDSKPCPKCGEFIMKSSGCFAVDTPIMMWNGGVKLSQHIAEGDELVGDDSVKRTVLGTVSGEDMMYEVTQRLNLASVQENIPEHLQFINGTTYQVNSKHTLVLYQITTSKVIEILVEDYVALPAYFKKELLGIRYGRYVSYTTLSVKPLYMGTYFGWSVDGNKRFLHSDGTLLRNCDQMYCVCCQTPFSWNTGKIVTSGPIHNPHYYEWMKRTGGAAPRNPADVPCGGFPDRWQIVPFPRGLSGHVSNIFYEFHRISQELQDISTRNYRSHMDITNTNHINVRFLTGDYDEKKWGQLLALNEKRRKRDAEIQEVFVAFRMVAVDIMNQVQNYSDNTYSQFGKLPVTIAEKFLLELDVQIQGLFTMINDAIRLVSVTHNQSVPYIRSIQCQDTRMNFYSIATKNFAGETRKKRGSTAEDEDKDEDKDEDVVTASTVVTASNAAAAALENDVVLPHRALQIRREYLNELEDETEDAVLQQALLASIQTR